MTRAPTKTSKAMLRPAERLRAICLALPDATEAPMRRGPTYRIANNIFAMELAGLPGGRLYPGSWSEWCAERSRPVATT